MDAITAAFLAPSPLFNLPVGWLVLVAIAGYFLWNRRQQKTWPFQADGYISTISSKVTSPSTLFNYSSSSSSPQVLIAGETAQQTGPVAMESSTQKIHAIGPIDTATDVQALASNQPASMVSVITTDNKAANVPVLGNVEKFIWKA